MRKILYLALLGSYSFPVFAATHYVQVGGSAGLVYSPQTIHIAVGDTVQWTNLGGKHNVQANDGSFVCAQGCRGDGHGGTGAPSSASWVARFTFNTAGSFGYFCLLHGSPNKDMHGTVIVDLTPVRLLSFDVE